MKYLRKFESVSEMNTVLANSTIGVLGVAYEGGNAVMENKPTPPAPVTKYNIYVEVDPENGGVVTGDGDYEVGSTVTLTATPTGSYSFHFWEDAYYGYTYETPTINITASEDSYFIAHFAVRYNINVTMQPSGVDTICYVTGGGTVNAGSAPTLNAVVPAGAPYVFERWERGGVNVELSPSYRVGIVNSNIDITAVFSYIPQDRTITVTSNNPSYGSVQIEDYLHQTSNTSLDIPERKNATMTATPNSGYQFEGWYYNNEKVSSDVVYTFTLPEHSEDRTYTANFINAQE